MLVTWRSRAILALWLLLVAVKTSASSEQAALEQLDPDCGMEWIKCSIRKMENPEKVLSPKEVVELASEYQRFQPSRHPRSSSGRRMRDPEVMQTTTTTTWNVSDPSLYVNATIEMVIYDNPLYYIGQQAASVNFCVFFNSSSVYEAIAVKATINEIMRKVYIEQGGPHIYKWKNETHREVDLHLRARVIYLNEHHDFYGNFRMIAMINELLSNEGCFFIGHPRADLNEIIAELVTSNGGLMISPRPVEKALLNKGQHVFSLAPHPNRFLDTALHLVTRSGSIHTVAYIYQEDYEFSEEHKSRCERIDSWATSQYHEVVFSGNIVDIGEVYNMTALELKPLRPDLVILCSDNPEVINQFVIAAFDVNLNPLAIIVASYYVGFSQYNTLTDNKGRYVIGIDLWSKRLTTVSDLCFPGFTNEDFVELTQNISTHDVDASNVWTALLWTSFELVFWAVQNSVTVPLTTPIVHDEAPTTMIYKTLSMSEVLKVMDSLRRRNISSLLGEVLFDSEGYRLAEYMATQWQQPPPGLADPRLVSPDEMIHVIAPTTSATNWLWFPNPTPIETRCFRTDQMGGMYGLQKADKFGALYDCGECNLGAVSHQQRTKVVGLEAFGDLSVRACVNCPKGTAQKSFMVTNGLNDSKCIPCEPGKHSHNPGLHQCLSCAEGTYQDAVGQEFCHLCPRGRYADVKGLTECYDCTYPEVSVVNGSARCTMCPHGAICRKNTDGYSTYTNKDNYWLFEPDLLDPEEWSAEKSRNPLGMVYPCFYEDDICKESNTCVDGDAMEGPMCSVCKPGYAKGGPLNTCSKCPPLFFSIILFVLDCIVGILLSVAMYIECVNSKSQQNHLIMIVLKQILSYCFLMECFNPFFRMHFGGEVKGDTSRLEEAGVFWSKFAFMRMAQECLLKELSPDNNVAYSMVIMGFAYIPLAVVQAILVSIGWNIRNTIVHRKNRFAAWEKLLGICLILIWYAHMACIRAFLEVFRCVNLDIERFVYGLDILCKSAGHEQWMQLAAIGLAVIGCGIPLVFFLLLRRLRVEDPLNLVTERNIRRWGFLFVGFRHERWYWESVLMLRKVVLAMLPHSQIMTGARALNRYNASRVGLLSFSILFFFLNKTQQPWDGRAFDLMERLESAMLQAFIATFALQVFLHELYNQDVSQEVFDASHGIVFMSTILFHLKFWAIAIHGVAMKSMKTYLSKFVDIHAKRAKQRLILRSDSVDCTSANWSSKRMLVKLITCIATIHLEVDDVFDVKEFIKNVRKVFTMTSYFEQLKSRLPRDKASEVYEDHQHVLDGEPPKDWDGDLEQVTAELLDDSPEWVHFVNTARDGASTDELWRPSTISLGAERQSEIERNISRHGGSIAEAAGTDGTGLSPQARLRLVERATTDTSLYENNEINIDQTWISYMRERNLIARRCRHKKLTRTVSEREIHSLDEEENLEDIQYQMSFSLGPTDSGTNADEAVLQKRIAKENQTFQNSIEHLEKTFDERIQADATDYRLPMFRYWASKLRKIEINLRTVQEENVELNSMLMASGLCDEDEVQEMKRPKSRRQIGSSGALGSVSFGVTEVHGQPWSRASQRERDLRTAQDRLGMPRLGSGLSSEGLSSMDAGVMEVDEVMAANDDITRSSSREEWKAMFRDSAAKISPRESLPKSSPRESSSSSPRDSEETPRKSARFEPEETHLAPAPDDTISEVIGRTRQAVGASTDDMRYADALKALEQMSKKRRESGVSGPGAAPAVHTKVQGRAMEILKMMRSGQQDERSPLPPINPMFLQDRYEREQLTGITSGDTTARKETTDAKDDTTARKETTDAKDTPQDTSQEQDEDGTLSMQPEVIRKKERQHTMETEKDRLDTEVRLLQAQIKEEEDAMKVLQAEEEELDAKAKQTADMAAGTTSFEAAPKGSPREEGDEGDSASSLLSPTSTDLGIPVAVKTQPDGRQKVTEAPAPHGRHTRHVHTGVSIRTADELKAVRIEVHDLENKVAKVKEEVQTVTAQIDILHDMMRKAGYRGGGDDERLENEG